MTRTGELELLEVAEVLGSSVITLLALDRPGEAALVQQAAESLAWEIKESRRGREAERAEEG